MKKSRAVELLERAQRQLAEALVDLTRAKTNLYLAHRGREPSCSDGRTPRAALGAALEHADGAMKATEKVIGGLQNAAPTPRAPSPPPTTA